MKQALLKSLRGLSYVIVAGAVAVLILYSVLGERALPYQLVDRATETGILFDYIGGREGRHWAMEQTGTGMGYIDHDNDGLLDIYFGQGHYLPGSDREGADIRNQLFHNFGERGYRDVTVTAECGDRGYAQGVAVGDYNNDGWDDIFVSNYDTNVLYRNDGDGSFTDVAEAAGLNASPYADDYANSCGFIDYNLDGFLDLYVTNYSSYRIETHEDLYSEGIGGDVVGISVYRGPPTLKGQQDILYRNNGDGTFTDATKEAGVDIRWAVLPEAGIYSPRAKGMSLAFPDINNDGWPDIFVGNDNDRQYLFINNQDGTFSETAETLGVLRSVDGEFCNLMGLDYGDLNGDGVVDIVASNFYGRAHELYISKPRGTYQAISDSISLGSYTRDFLTWGTGLVDLDNDADLDLFISAGHVMDNADIVQDEPVPQHNLLFENRFNEGGDFTNVTELAGSGMLPVKWSRAALFGDLDDDGDIDVLVGNMPLDDRNIDGRCTVLMNEWKEDVEANNWITFSLRGTISNRNALGARLYLTAGDLELMGDCKATFSYLCSNDRRVHFGLGKHTQVDSLEVHWPSGIVTTHKDIPANQFLTLTEPDTPPPGTQLRRLRSRQSE